MQPDERIRQGILRVPDEMEVAVHVNFTERENRYLVKEPFNWHVSNDAPDDVRKSIEQKLNAIDGQRIGPSRDLWKEVHPNG